MDEIVSIVPLLLVCSALVLVASIATLAYLRQSTSREAPGRHRALVGAIRAASWTLTIACAIVTCMSLVLLLAAFLKSLSRVSLETAYAVAALATIGGFLLGAAMLTVTHWFTGPQPGASRSAFVGVIWTCAWTLTIASFVLGFFLMAPWPVIVCLAILASVVSMATSKHAETQQYALLALLGAAADRSMPLETAVAAYGHERGGWMRRRAIELVRFLLDGVPLPAAVERVPGVLPPEAVPLVRVGHETGTLPSAIDKAISARNLFEPVWQMVVPKIGYICLLPTVALGIIAFIMLKIVPQFEKIFHDFGMALPRVTRALIVVAHSAGQWWGLLGAALLITILLLFYCMLRYAGWIRWDLPGMAWLTRRRHTATLLDAISLAARQQRPLANTVLQLAAGYPQRSVARRLWSAYGAMKNGEEDLECLYRHGLLAEGDVALLRSAVRNGNVAWAAAELADSNRRRMIYRANAVTQVIFPSVIVVYSFVAVWIAAALFFPLVALIGGLSGGQ